LIAELPQPLVVRRTVAFAEAVYAGEVTVEEITACLAKDPSGVEDIWEQGNIAVIVDPQLDILTDFKPQVLVDGRMLKQTPEMRIDAAPLVIGLGPGFTAGENCHAVVETMRGPFLGRVIWEGSAQSDTGIPDRVKGKREERVLRAPADGKLIAHANICDQLEKGDLIAEVGGMRIASPFKGVLRGLIHDGITVKAGMKIGDVDPRDDPALCTLISDKALAVGGGVLEAILSKQ
jgi:xanthine dehydrogenase accessory factor